MEEARCRVWLLPPLPPPHVQDRVRLLLLLLLVEAMLFSSPGVFSKPLGLVHAIAAASWWVAVNEAAGGPWRIAPLLNA